MVDAKAFHRQLPPAMLVSMALIPTLIFPTLLAVFCLLATGCADGPTKTDPAILNSLREVLVMDAEPEGAITPLDWRDEIEAAEASDPPATAHNQIVLVGKVGGMPNPWPEQYPKFPWVRDESTFFLVDPSTVAEFEAHAGGSAEEAEAHAADCPFCAREAANQSKAVAAISFVDEKGEPNKIDIRELFGLAKGDVVVVKGTASMLGDDLLVVQANGLFRRK